MHFFSLCLPYNFFCWSSVYKLILLLMYQHLNLFLNLTLVKYSEQLFSFWEVRLLAW